MIRRVLTKPVWWWERHRNYPIRSRFNQLPPLPVSEASRKFVVLTTPGSFDDALWTAWSWYRFLGGAQFELQFVVAGQPPETAVGAAQKLFPGVRVRYAESVIAALDPPLPGLDSFVRNHPLGSKFGIILALSQESEILYADHDVLAFNPPYELLAHVQSAMPVYMAEEHRGNFDSAIVQRLDALRIGYLDKLNSGFLYIPRRALSIDLASALLAQWTPPYSSWFTEQTLLSALLHQANALPLPSDRYVISNRRQFNSERDVDYRKIAARHFTGTVRHVMYKFGMPAILQQSASSFSGVH